MPGDETLRNYLQWDRKPPFNEKVVGKFISQLRDTIAFAGLSSSDTVPEENPPELPESEEGEDMHTPRNQVPPAPPPPNASAGVLPPVPKGFECFPLVLSRTERATLSIPSSITKKQMALLRSQIENTLNTIEAAYDEEPD